LRDNSVNNDGDFSQLERVFFNKTPSHCFTPIAFTPRCYNVPCQFTSFLYLLSLIFRFHSLWLAAHLDAARRARIPRRKTKLRGYVFIANYVSHRALAI